jgi:hypothetical protein
MPRRGLSARKVGPTITLLLLVLAAGVEVKWKVEITGQWPPKYAQKADKSKPVRSATNTKSSVAAPQYDYGWATGGNEKADGSTSTWQHTGSTISKSRVKGQPIDWGQPIDRTLGGREVPWGSDGGDALWGTDSAEKKYRGNQGSDKYYSDLGSDKYSSDLGSEKYHGDLGSDRFHGDLGSDKFHGRLSSRVDFGYEGSYGDFGTDKSFVDFGHG